MGKKSGLFESQNTNDSGMKHQVPNQASLLNVYMHFEL